MKKAYIALLGRSTWATLNTYYSTAYKGYHPDRIWLVTESRYEEDLTKLDEGIQIISTGFDHQPTINSIVLEEGDIIEAARAYAPSS